MALTMSVSGGELIVAGVSSSYRLPGSQGSRGAPPNLPLGPLTKLCLSKETCSWEFSLFCLTNITVGPSLPPSSPSGRPPLFCVRLGGGDPFGLQPGYLKSQVASDNVQRARPRLTERVNILIHKWFVQENMKPRSYKTNDKRIQL